MIHTTEDDLIAWHLHEAAQASAIARHLKTCDACAARSDSIAETLRVFSADPVPQANLDHAWQRLCGNLPILATPRRAWTVTARRISLWLAPVLALVLVAVVTRHLTHPLLPTTIPVHLRTSRPSPLSATPPALRPILPAPNACLPKSTTPPVRWTAPRNNRHTTFSSPMRFTCSRRTPVAISRRLHCLRIWVACLPRSTTNRQTVAEAGISAFR